MVCNLLYCSIWIIRSMSQHRPNLILWLVSERLSDDAVHGIDQVVEYDSASDRHHLGASDHHPQVSVKVDSNQRIAGCVRITGWM